MVVVCKPNLVFSFGFNQAEQFQCFQNHFNLSVVQKNIITSFDVEERILEKEIKELECMNAMWRFNKNVPMLYLDTLYLSL